MRKLLLLSVLLVGSTFLAAPATAQCTDSDTVKCLRDGRFEVSVTWKDFADRQGVGHTVDTGNVTSDDSVLFWFFRDRNWEILVKVLDGCSVTQAFWVFAAATTNVGYTLSVTDTLTDTTKVYENPLGRASDAVTDTKAFETCDA